MKSKKSIHDVTRLPPTSHNRFLNLAMAKWCLQLGLILFVLTLIQWSLLSTVFQESAIDLFAHPVVTHITITNFSSSRKRVAIESNQINDSHHHNHNHQHDDSSDDDPSRYHSCLRNVNIVMMGDSLMRYQYLSLVYFLRWGRWFDPNITVNNLVNEKSWSSLNASMIYGGGAAGGPRHRRKKLRQYYGNLRNNNNKTAFASIFSLHAWNDFFRHTHQLVGGDEYEVCDCVRDSDIVKQSKQAQRRTFENRYYHDPFRNNTVVYILAFGHKATIHGRVIMTTAHARPPLSLEQQPSVNSNHSTVHPRDLLGKQSDAAVWEYDEWHEVIQYYIAPYLRPDYIVLNAGLWPNHFYDANHTTLLKQALDALLPTTRGMWRTTTYGRNGTTTPAIQQVDEAVCREFVSSSSSSFHRCLNISWTRHLVPSLYCDYVHFLEPVYRSINEQMLESMGYLSTSTATTTTSTTNSGGDQQCHDIMLTQVDRQKLFG